MARERDAVNLQSGSAGHFHVHDRERDGNAEAALEDDVQQAVAEVVVVGAVPAEAFAREEQPIERSHPRPHRGRAERIERHRRKIAEPRELRQRRARIELRELELGDDERRGRHVNRGARQHARQLAGQRVVAAGDTRAGPHVWPGVPARAWMASRASISRSTRSIVTSSSESTVASAPGSASAV